MSRLWACAATWSPIPSHLGYAPYGAYGIGENIGASLSALAPSAIYNATGKWILDFIAIPDKVLKALGKVLNSVGRRPGPDIDHQGELPCKSLFAVLQEKLPVPCT